jgi:predicted NUDIX family NTP pyrophosphohydrolase
MAKLNEYVQEGLKGDKMKQFQVDDQVRITHSAIGREELHGQVGIIVFWDDTEYMGHCQLDGGKTVTVYSDELELVEADETL